MIPVDTFFINLLIERLWVQRQNIIFSLVIQIRFLTGVDNVDQYHSVHHHLSILSVGIENT